MNKQEIFFVQDPVEVSPGLSGFRGSEKHRETSETNSFTKIRTTGILKWVCVYAP
jgi:hypothetical protein